LLGAFLPNTCAGTIVGNPTAATPVAIPVFKVDVTKSLLVIDFFLLHD